MKVIIELEKKDGEWSARLLSADKVEVMGIAYYPRDTTVEHAQAFVQSAADILEN